MADDLATRDDSSLQEVQKQGFVSKMRNMSFGKKLAIALTVDIVDLVMVYFLPGIGSIINFFYDILATGLAFVMLGLPGLTMLWEVVEFTGALDAWIFTLTFTLIGVYGTKWLKKTLTTNPTFKKIWDFTVRTPFLGAALKKVLPDSWHPEKITAAIQRADELMESMPGMEELEELIGLNVGFSKEIASKMENPGQIDDEAYRSSLAEDIGHKIDALNHLIEKLDELIKSGTFTGRNIESIKALTRQYKLQEVKLLTFKKQLEEGDLE